MTNTPQYAEIYYSSDVEASGPIPGLYSMTSFGVVATGARTLDGDYVRFDVDEPSNCFYRELQLLPGAKIDPEAMAVAGLTEEHLAAHGVDPHTAMGDFNRWVVESAARLGGGKAVFAAYPLPFDWMFVYYYLMAFHGSSAFGFSSTLDMKTYAAAALDLPIKKISKGRGGAMRQFVPQDRPHTHNSLDDAREQGIMLMNLLEAARSGR